MDDLTLKRNVLDELNFEPSIDAADIGVSAEDGIIRLTGHVVNYAQKYAAQRAVQRVHGVRAVADNIEVRFPGTPAKADDEIAKRAADILAWDALVPADKIKVSVRDGYVTLAGQVDWQYQRNAAETAIGKLSHVAGINNQIEIRAHAKPADIRTKIEAALKRSAEAEARRIKVSVDNGRVTLEGYVDNWSERNAVKNAA